MMTFSEFSRKVKEDARLFELLNRYDDDPMSLSDDEVAEMVSRSERIYNDDFSD